MRDFRIVCSRTTGRTIIAELKNGKVSSVSVVNMISLRTSQKLQLSANEIMIAMRTCQSRDQRDWV
jgi:hypothetical protein